MRRLAGPVGGLLLLGVVGHAAAAQRSPPVPRITLEEPRPNPVLPAALVPFAVPSELCRRGHVPVVALKVYNVLASSVATLRLRGRRAEPLDSLPLRCGSYVAIWDGTVDSGKRVAAPGVYYLQLAVDSIRTTKKVVVAQP